MEAAGNCKHLNRAQTSAFKAVQGPRALRARKTSSCSLRRRRCPEGSHTLSLSSTTPGPGDDHPLFIVADTSPERGVADGPKCLHLRRVEPKSSSKSSCPRAACHRDCDGPPVTGLSGRTPGSAPEVHFLSGGVAPELPARAPQANPGCQGQMGAPQLASPGWPWRGQGWRVRPLGSLLLGAPGTAWPLERPASAQTCPRRRTPLSLPTARLVRFHCCQAPCSALPEPGANTCKNY